MVHFEMPGNKIYNLKGRDGNGTIDHCYNNEACACRLNHFVLGNKDLPKKNLYCQHKHKDITLTPRRTEIWKYFSEFVD